jgi:hypothetical protein
MEIPDGWVSLLPGKLKSIFTKVLIMPSSVYVFFTRRQRKNKNNSVDSAGYR